MVGILSVWDIVCLNIVAVTSLRWLASAAASGPSSITLWIIATLAFFIPQGLAVASLASRFPDQGGLYRWTQRAFGDRHAFMCGWCYWVNNLLYFPGLLMFISANIAFALHWINPAWAVDNNKFFVTAFTLGILWTIAGVSIVGLRLGKWFQNIGGVGNWIPFVVIVVMGVAVYVKFGAATPITPRALVPDFSDPKRWSFFAQMCFAFAGLELVSFLGGEVKNPRRTITTGLVISAILIVGMYLVGTLGILAAVPVEKITLLNGILLPIEEAGKRFGLHWLGGFSAFFIAVAGIGGVMAWFSGAARIPYVVGVDRYLPRSFARLHPKFGTPTVAILVQAAVATLFTFFATAGGATKMETAYLVLVDMCLILYFIPYCYLFLSLWKLRRETTASADAYRIPAGKFGTAVVALTGLVTTLVAIVTSLAPNLGSADWGSVKKTALGTGAMLTVGGLLYVRGQWAKQGKLGWPFYPGRLGDETA